MKGNMFINIRKQFKIFYTIISFNIVNMMNNLFFIKRSTNMLFHNYSMFQNISFFRIIKSFRVYQNNITMRINAFSNIIPSCRSSIFSFKGFRYLSFLSFLHRTDWFSFKEQANTFFRAVLFFTNLVWVNIKTFTAYFTNNVRHRLSISQMGEKVNG